MCWERFRDGSVVPFDLVDRLSLFFIFLFYS